MNLISAIGRVMENNGIIRGDTDLPTTLTDLQHGATIRIARNAIQDELNELVADSAIPYEHTGTGSIATVASTRSYALDATFVRFFGRAVLTYDTNNLLYEYPGGEAALLLAFPDYKTRESEPMNWYFDLTTTKKIAFWPVPQAAKTYTYDFEKDVSVTAASDTLPFHNEMEAQAFVRMAGRRFKFLYEEMDLAQLPNDPEHMRAKSTLTSLMIGKNPSKRWAPVYR